jgi:hypothetical protein
MSKTVVNITNSNLTYPGYITTISGGSSISTTSATIGTSTIGIQTNRYYILGEYIDLPINDFSGTLSTILATLNVLGRPFYEELKKQPISLPNELSELIEKRLIITERESKISSIINKE